MVVTACPYGSDAPQPAGFQTPFLPRGPAIQRPERRTLPIIRHLTLATLGCAAVAANAPFEAAYAGEKLLRVVAGHVNPKANYGAVVDVDSGPAFVINASYFLPANLAVELLASLPFSHDVRLAATGINTI